MATDQPESDRSSDGARRFLNSIIISVCSTVLSVTLGTITAYALSRFKVKAKNDILFFILSTRMLPAVVVTIPLYLMFKYLSLMDTHVGLILLYSAFNVSFSVWVMKGFIDDIPEEYEKAALVDGYSRMQTFRIIVIPQAATGIAATTVFCFIFSWNEYAFSLMMTSRRAQTATAFIQGIKTSACNGLGRDRGWHVPVYHPGRRLHLPHEEVPAGRHHLWGHQEIGRGSFMATIRLTHVTKSFVGTQAVNDLSLEIREREFLVLVRPVGVR